jgi:hypothetical protein
MSNRFDELAKGLASGLTRRDALKRFAGGLAGLLFADVALGSKAEAQAADTCPDYCRSIGINPGGGNAFGKCVSNCAHCKNEGGTPCGASGCCTGEDTCENGVCTPPNVHVCTGCVGCGALVPCGTAGECACWNRTDISGVCYCASFPSNFCADYPACASDADCTGGAVCASNCCPTGICVTGCGTQAPQGPRSGMPGTLTR